MSNRTDGIYLWEVFQHDIIMLENGTAALAQALGLIHMLLEFCTEVITEYCRWQLDSGAHCTSIGDSTAGPDVVSPDTYERFALPYEKAIVDEVHASGGLFSLHICGNATSIINQMLHTKSDIFEIDHKTDLLKAMKATYGKTAILGHISPMLIRNGQKSEIRDAVKSSLDCTKNYGGHILGAGCALSDDTCFENITEIIDAANSNYINPA